MKTAFQKAVTWPLCLLFLLGFISSGHSMVLCIGDDGHFEVETICLPDCDDENIDNAAEKPDMKHEEHSDCSNCSDVELGSSLWVKRLQNIDYDNSTNIELNILANATIDLTSVIRYDSKITKFHLAYGQSPPADIIKLAVFLC